MGLSLVWIAVSGVDADEFLDRAGFEDTGEPDPWFETDYSGAELPGGWYVLVTGDFGVIENMGLLADWSAGARLIVAVADEGSMNSLAMEWIDRRQIWSVFHDGSEGEPTLAVDGDLPDAFEAIRARLMAAQAGESAGPPDGSLSVDHVFDIPIELAAGITGFRHDHVDEDAGFTALEPL